MRNTIDRINFNASFCFFAGMKVEQVKTKLKFAAFVTVEDTTMGSDGKAAAARTEMKNFIIRVNAEDVDATLKKMLAGRIKPSLTPVLGWGTAPGSSHTKQSSHPRAPRHVWRHRDGGRNQ